MSTLAVLPGLPKVLVPVSVTGAVLYLLVPVSVVEAVLQAMPDMIVSLSWIQLPTIPGAGYPEVATLPMQVPVL